MERQQKHRHNTRIVLTKEEEAEEEDIYTHIEESFWFSKVRRSVLELKIIPKGTKSSQEVPKTTEKEFERSPKHYRDHLRQPEATK